MTVDIVTFIRSRLNEDEREARAAGGAYGSPTPASGEHWRWVYSFDYDPRVDTPVDITEQDEEGQIAEGAEVGLRSIEHYPLRNIPGTNPHLVMSHLQEVEAGAARHIVRHDPARVLRGVKAKRRIVDECTVRRDYEAGPLPDYVLCQIASEWSDHRDYQAEWA